MPHPTWTGGILRGQSGRCPHKVARVYSRKMSPLVQGTNPDFPHLTHAVTMAVTLPQLGVFVREPYQWLPAIRASAPSRDHVDVRHFPAGNFLLTVEWMWHACRTGIAVSIRNRTLEIFVPFCNPDYINTWSANARAATPQVGLTPDRWWANGWTLCGDAVSDQLWGDQGVCAIQNMLMVACERGEVGDCDFIINKRDSACVRLDGCDAMNPMDPYQRPLPRPALVPVLSLYTGDQFADIAMPLPSDWHRLSRGTFEGQKPLPPVPRPREVSWRDKQDCAIFRGSLTGAGGHAGTNQRIALLHMHDGEHLDLRGTGASQRLRRCPLEKSVVMPHYGHLDVGRRNFIPLAEQQERYRYTVTIDGHSGADRLAALAGGNQVVLKVAPPLHALCPDTWASQRMHAWEHYLPVCRQMTDLRERLQWARQHPDECARLRRNCSAWASEERASVLQWWVDCTQAMSRQGTCH
jgi:hypothetical protein